MLFVYSNKDDECHYYNKKESLFKNWYIDNEFIKNWSKGTTPLKYEDSTVKTEIGFGEDFLNKTITCYLIK